MIGGALLSRTAVMPLVDLHCVGGEAGLYAAIEGAGNSVSVLGPLSYTKNECSNPSQFRQPDSAVDVSTVEACAPGGVGAPALVGYCRDSCDGASPQLQWDLWVDASEIERDDEFYRPVDFGVCGYARQAPDLPDGTNGDWTARPPGTAPYLWTVPPSSREPTLLPVADYASSHRVEQLWFAVAEASGPEIYDLHGDQLFTTPTSGSMAPPLLLQASAVDDCESLRDPLLVADWTFDGDGNPSVRGSWLFFTCVRSADPASIGVVHLDQDRNVTDGTLRTDVLTSDIGDYADRGVWAPEGFSEVRSRPDEITVRLWFSTRDDAGHVQLGYAQGRGPLADGLPALAPYPANPILDGASPILGGDCSGDCVLDGVSVTPHANLVGRYQFLVSRSRRTASAVVHELVPLLQPAPNDG